VVDVRINIDRVALVGGLERGLIGRDAGVDALVEPGIVQQQRRAGSSALSVPIMSRALSSSAGVPPSGESMSTAKLRRPSSAMRRATSWMCGLSARFSWMTITAGRLPLDLSRARVPLIGVPAAS